jgi:hypothetical protein
MRPLRITVGVAAVAAVVCASATNGQNILLGGRGRTPPRFATAQDFDGQFVYCRGFYRSDVGEPGGQGWSTDYPAADNNFSVRLMELTRISVKLLSDRQPGHVVVRLDDPLLYRCPILFMEDVGTLRFSDDEVHHLRDFLLKGGILWTDDFWGSAAWARWTEEIGRVLPPSLYPIVDIPLSHPVMHSLYDIKERLQVSSINFWSRSGGQVSERGEDSADVHYRGIQDDRGRLMVFMTHNTDIADTWEREGDNRQYFELFSPRGYALGVNFVLYAMTH